MKKICLLVVFATLASFLAAQSPTQLTLLSRWDADTLPIASPGSLNLQYNSVWGMAVNGREIAVLGNARYVLFFDVTNPAEPELVGKFEGSSTTIWREFKSYKNRVYAVSDGTQEGLMIFDLTNAPQNITRSYWSNEFFRSSHSIMLDTVSGHIYLNGNSEASMLVLDVSQNPDKPTVWSKVQLTGGYIHDSYVRCDTLYASSGYNGYYIYDFKSKPQAPKTLASVSTGGYNHNSWLSVDGRYAYYTEEIPRGRPIQIVDLKDLSTSGDIELVGSFLDEMLADTFATPQAIPHNVYIRCDYLFNSQYEDGLLVYDLADPLNPKLKYWYDTHPENTKYNGYYGCWGNYPWLPSGNILASDMQNGLFVFGSVDIDCQLPVPDCAVISSAPETSKDLPVGLAPNPASDVFRVDFQSNEAWQFHLLSSAGKLLKTGPGTSEITVSELPAGIYFLEIRTASGQRATRRFVKN